MDGPGPKDGEGLNRAAILITLLEKPVLAALFKHLSPLEISNLMRGYENLAKTGSSTDSQLISVARSFLSTEGGESGSHFKDALVMAFGDDNMILLQDQWAAIADRVKPDAVALVLRDERPEAVAIALSQLPARFASDVLVRLPDELRAVAMEILTRAESAPRGALDAILRALEESLNGKAGPNEVDQKTRAKRAATMLNQLEPESATAIVEHIRACDPERAAAIEAEMFHFGDFLRVDNRSQQQVLAEISPERIALALKTTTEDERAIIFAALPQQVRIIVQAEISDTGKVPMREVTAARREITELAILMDRQGRIHLRSDGELVA